MQTLRRAVGIFCMACIAAELVALLTGSSRSVRCIKAVAGLYILTVLLSLLPGASAGVRAMLAQTVVEAPSFSLSETMEEQLRSDAAAQLEQLCIARCRREFGVEIRLALTLESIGQETAVTHAAVQFPAECDAGRRQAILTYLQQELSVVPAAVEEVTP